MVSEKRDDIIDLLKSEVVWITSEQLSSATGVQSENHVLMAVGVIFCDSCLSISSHISFREFMFSPLD
jgi:hypothetical protein